MQFNTTRREFLTGMAGAVAFGATGGFAFGAGMTGKIRLAAVGVNGKGYSDWTPMVKFGLAEMVAFCDCDKNLYEDALKKAKKDLPGTKLSSVPFYSDYRRLFDAIDSGKVKVDAMTISTPDHAHAPIAILAMKRGIHVYVQKPLVRTLWELDYFNKTARENKVIVQMGNQGSSLNSMRRCTEVIQSGILGDVKEVHVWTNRPVWPQGKGVADYVKAHPKGDKVRDGLDWNAFIATAKDRPFLDQYPEGADVYDPWKLGKNVYHKFTWRGFFDFGAGAFGDMACHTMNLAFRGLELGGVSDAKCVKIESANDIAYPLKSIVELTYKARKSNIQKGKTLPAVKLFWYDGGFKPDAGIMPKWARTHKGKVPNTGCYIIGSKGAVLMQDDYGAKCAIALDADKKFVDIFSHEAAKAVDRSIPYCKEGEDVKVGKSTVEMKGFGIEHYKEFLTAIRGEGNFYKQTNSRCFSDIEYCIPQMEGILVGCMAQRVPGVKLNWDSSAQKFDNAVANTLVKPYIREGWKF